MEGSDEWGQVESTGRDELWFPYSTADRNVI